VIRITTPSRFTEPFLSFLIEADWGKGQGHGAEYTR
jgi:pilus assembly protein FimV